MIKKASADVVIFGGGIAGLWLLNRLRQAGITAILFESGALGGGQTHKSQGIIHGGMKYALHGIKTGEAEAMKDMPAIWRECLSGRGEADLSRVPVLSPQHYLWSPAKLTAKLTGFLAGATLTSEVQLVSREHYPSAFQDPQFKGEVFSLGEIVVDVPAVIREMVKANQHAIYKIEPLSGQAMKFDKAGNLVSTIVYFSGQGIEVKAQQFVFTAGAGNEVIINKLNHHAVTMQRRPLHMVMVKTPFQHSLYAHCLGWGVRPRLTITTHKLQDGSMVWYLGGLLAEEGVHREPPAQIAAARAELSSLFPWLDFSSAVFSTLRVDRAEPLQKDGLKPDSSFMRIIHNMMIAWPTKLALAPKLANDMLEQLQTLTPQFCDIRALQSWPMPPLAIPVWEEAFCKAVC